MPLIVEVIINGITAITMVFNQMVEIIGLTIQAMIISKDQIKIFLVPMVLVIPLTIFQVAVIRTGIH